MSTSKNDIAAMIGKGVVGALPFVGPLAAEVIGSLIPNQRIDRIESLLKILEAKIEEKDRSKVAQKIYAPESIDLLEDGFIQASRALSEERKEYIASLLKNSLTNEQLKHIEYKKLLSILGDLNDLEILLLKAQSMYSGHPEYTDFWGKHESVLTPPRAHLGSAREDADKHAIYQTYKTHLVNLGLIRIRYKKPKRGELPEFDEKTGMVKAQGYDTTPLGRLLLRNIDLSASNEN